MQKPFSATGLSNKDYQAYPAYSKTFLKNFERDAAYAKFMQRFPAKSSAMDLGTAFHSYVENGKPTHVVWHKTRRGKAWDEFEKKNQEKLILTAAQEELFQGMKKSWEKKGYRDNYQEDCLYELSVFWNEHFEKRENFTYHITRDAFLRRDPKTTIALPLKCRPDILPNDYTIVDLKTASEISPNVFGRNAWRYRFHWSAWLTTRGLTELTGSLHQDYYFLVIESKPPFDIVTYKVTQAVIDLAGQEIGRILPYLAECHEKDEWPGQPQEVQDLVFPGWAFTQNQQALIHDPPAF